MRICIAYDCLYPWTVGGAERWYRNLATELAAVGHEVTYITRRQWPEDQPPVIRGVSVTAVSPEEELYGPGGNRRIGEAIRFGMGVFRHLLSSGKDYDVVHTASFPYFSVLAAAAARPFASYKLVVDWHEVWSASYWRGYLGPVRGTVGALLQFACIRTRHRPFCFSRLHRDRLLDNGIRERPTLLEGEFTGVERQPDPAATTETKIVFAGRHIREKRPTAAVQAIAEVRRRGLDARGIIFGEGPERESVIELIETLRLGEYVTAPGFADRQEVESEIASALCLLHPSSREGYGLVVVEASALGTPVVLARGDDNAATELVLEGTNGKIADSSSAGDLADAIMEIASMGDALRQTTRTWFEAEAERLSMASSLAVVAESYAH